MAGEALEIKVHIKVPCMTCRKQGVIEHPLWLEFHRSYGDNYSEQNAKDWFAKKGKKELPPETIPCPQCKGALETTDWMTMTQFKQIVRS